MQRSQYSTILLALLSVLILSCGGESERDFTSSSDEIDAIWEGGVKTENGDFFPVLGLSDSDDNLHIILESSDNASLVGSALFTNGSVEINFSNLTRYNAAGDFVDELKFEQGTFVQPDSQNQGSLDAVLRSDTTSEIVNIELIYDDLLYERNSSLDLLSGTWVFDDFLGNTLTLEIDSDGVITRGVDSDGCQYTGDFAILKSDRNLYRASIDISCFANPPISTTGLATLTVVNFQERLIYSVTGIDTTKSESVAFVERLTKQP